MEEQMYAIRRAYHAGSWYEGSGNKLDAELTTNLANVEEENQSRSDLVRGLVGPHAGFRYSGPTAAFGYKRLISALRSDTIDTIIVLHPSHHVYLDGCAISGASEIETPLGNLKVASELRKKLWTTKKFSLMDQKTDEEEHSGELHYPYIAKCLREANAFDRVRVLPIMVGSINAVQEENFGSLMKEFISLDNIITIVSTDFCHWGSKFQYQPKPSVEEDKSIFQHISELDHAGMNFIEMQKPGAFANYLKETRNTICGRHPLAVYLHAISQNKEARAEYLNVKFVRYAQSSEVVSMRDSSVSYASAVATRAES